MTPIENQELRGISLKTAIIVVGSTISLALSGAYGVSRINARADKSDAIIEKYIYQNETEMRMFRVRLDMVEQQLHDMKYNKSDK